MGVECGLGVWGGRARGGGGERGAAYLETFGFSISIVNLVFSATALCVGLRLFSGFSGLTVDS